MILLIYIFGRVYVFRPSWMGRYEGCRTTHIIIAQGEREEGRDRQRKRKRQREGKRGRERKRERGEREWGKGGKERKNMPVLG